MSRRKVFQLTRGEKSCPIGMFPHALILVCSRTASFLRRYSDSESQLRDLASAIGQAVNIGDAFLPYQTYPSCGFILRRVCNTQEIDLRRIVHKYGARGLLKLYMNVRLRTHSTLTCTYGQAVRLYCLIVPLEPKYLCSHTASLMLAIPLHPQ